MRYLNYFVIIVAVSLTLSACKKEDPNPTPSPSPNANAAPTSPVFSTAPASGSVDVNSPLQLAWHPSSDTDGDAITYDVYLGTDNSAISLVSQDQSDTTYNSVDLELGTQYYFKVVAKDGVATSESETRNFTSAYTGTFTDTRDGTVYGTILIGDQVWMAENLKYNLASLSYSYNNNSTNDATYGRLYNWSGVTAATPSGWHLPTDDEWKTLETNLGMPAADLDINDYLMSRGTDQGTQLKVGGASGLDFPIAGFYDGATFSALGNRTYLWVNTLSGGSVFRRRLEASSSSCFRFTNPSGSFAISVRLVKD